MKIIYFGNFSRTYSTELYVAYALSQKGVEVERINSINDMSFQECKSLIRSSQCNVVLFAKLQPSWTAQLLVWCRQHKIITVCWVWDLYWGYGRPFPKQFHSDLLFTTDGGHKKEFAGRGYNHSVLRQGIHLPEHVKYAEDYTHDVAFVGGYGKYAPRQKLIEWLAQKYGNRFIHHTHKRGLDLNKALARVKLVVGDSHPSDGYWSNRIYEITGRGGFLLHPKVVGLDREFADGVHYVSYKRDKHGELAELIGYWLGHDDERKAIQQQGFNHCGNRYTYEHRVETLLTCIKEHRGH